MLGCISAALGSGWAELFAPEAKSLLCKAQHRGEGLSQCSREDPWCEDNLLPAFRSTSGAEDTGDVAPDVRVLSHLELFALITSHPGEPEFPFGLSVTSRPVETLGVRGELLNL